MGFSRLNIWLRSEECRPFKIQRPGLDYVVVRNCMGDEVKRVDVPVGESHVEVEVPPGCYIAQGHVCEPGINDYTDKAMVMVGCNQELCVNLIVPKVRTCARRDLNAFVREARLARVQENDIRITAQTILAAGRISLEETVANIQGNIAAIKDVKEASEVVREYQATLKTIRG